MALENPKAEPIYDPMERQAVINYDEKFRNTKTEWKRFITQSSGKGSGRSFRPDPSIIPDDILESWLRCRALGVDPFQKPAILILSEEEIRDMLDENEIFIHASDLFMNNLYRFLQDGHFLVSLFDRNGYILKVIGDDHYIDLARKNDLVVGALWDEKTVGNNTAGTVSSVKRPIQIFGPQHYNKVFHLHTTSSAPIFDPDGNFIGGLSLTGCYYRSNPHTLGMAVAAAQAIENELKTRKALAQAQLCSTYQHTVISSIPEALIAIDNRGFVSLMNDNAKKMFAVDFGRPGDKHIRKLFNEENAAFLNLIEKNVNLVDIEVRIFSSNSWGDYTLTCNPIQTHHRKTIGKVIILNEIKRAKSMVNKIMGAKAKFRFEDICGRNRRFLMTVDQARMVSRNNSNVLLLGKSGTGKDVFAQCIHNASDRRNGPYIAINCGAIPRDLIVSELFGHEEGAYTGSRRGGNQGKFELAEGGTLFLDEITETPLELQTALLRVIEDKSIIRVGGSRVRPVDVRIIAATNKDLREEVRRGNFREDLYYRANVFAIEMVPLNERPDDIPLLVDFFIEKYSRSMGKKVEGVEDKVIGIFMNYPWPGNIRELQNTIERMMNFTISDRLTSDLIPAEIAGHGKITAFPGEIHTPKDFERQMIAKMVRSNLSKSEIAQKLAISRPTLYRKMKEYNLF